jgi:hypothetical protein
MKKKKKTIIAAAGAWQRPDLHQPEVMVAW